MPAGIGSVWMYCSFWFQKPFCPRVVDGYRLRVTIKVMYKQRAREKGFNTWLAKPKVSRIFGRVFPSGEATPPYFQGKCYMLSRRLCKFVSGMRCILWLRSMPNTLAAPKTR